MKKKLNGYKDIESKTKNLLMNLRGFLYAKFEEK